MVRALRVDATGAGDSGTGATPPPLERAGPYRVLGPLARGGCGIVYRAVHVGTGEVVALKALQVLAPPDLQSMRRETHALGRIRHPGVVRLVAQGVEADVPWYAMELIEGESLESRWSGLVESAAPPPRAVVATSLRIIRRLCGTLAFLHGEGIVHRDLKPANVVVRDGDNPVLIDFGLVARFAGPLNREALEVGGEVVGTFEYMAPEQARGEYVDARADLYALGCMLYQAVTGRPPFSGTPWEIYTQHVQVRPARPSQASDVPAALEELILRLLDKEPRRRLGYATDVADALAPFAQDGEPAPQDPRPYLYRPSFVGRGEMLARLERTLGRAVEGVGACVLVAGESGVGKTRLAMEVTREATHRGLRVVTGECVPVEGAGASSEMRSAPLHPLRPLLRSIADHCRSRDPGMGSRVLGRRGKVLAAYEPSLATLPGQADLPDPAPLAAPAARARLLSDLAETIAAFAHEAPLVVVLDDLQWADDLTLALLGSLPPSYFANNRLLLLGTYRSEEVGAALRALAKSPSTTVVALDRLEPTTVGSIVGDMLAMQRPPPTLVGVMARESEGNPFFVAEYLRAAVGARLLDRTVSGEWRITWARTGEETLPTLPLPHTLHEIIARRLANLGTAAQAVLEGAAVVGRELDADLAAAVAGLDEQRQLDGLTQLLARQVMEETDGARLRFAHDKVREVAYARIPPHHARTLHRRTAEYLEARHAADADFPQRYAVLAHHWTMAGVDHKALEYLTRAGAHALRTGAHADARDLLSRGLALDARLGHPGGRRQQARWLRMLGEAAIGIGDLDGCVEHMSAALRLFGQRVPTSRRGWVAVLAVEIGRQAAHRLLAAVPRRRPARHEVWIETAEAAAQLGTSYYFRGDAARAIPNVLRSVNCAERAGGGAALVPSYGRLGFVAGAAGLHRLARGYFRRGHMLADRTRDVVGSGVVLWTDAQYQLGLARWEPSRTLAEQSIVLLRDAGDRQETEIGQLILGHALYYAGRFAEAAESCALLAESARARSNRQHTGWGLFLEGRALFALGDERRALQLIEEGRTTLAPLAGVDRTATMADAWLARVLLALGDVERARALAFELLDGLRDRPPPPAPPLVDSYAAAADVLLRLWASDHDEATGRAARRACAELHRFARTWRLAMPPFLRALAWKRWLSGHPAAAHRAWARSLRAASAYAMPLEEAHAHADLSRYGAAPEERARHRRAAERLFTALGCAGHLRTLDAPAGAHR